jgi:hypothetical protein
MLAASQQAASIETKRRLDLEYQFANGIWYSTQRLEKEGEPELRDLDGVLFFDKVNIKKLLPIVHIQSPIFRAYLTYIHDRLLDHPGVEQTLKGIRETMMTRSGQDHGLPARVHEVPQTTEGPSAEGDRRLPASSYHCSPSFLPRDDGHSDRIQRQAN